MSKSEVYTAHDVFESRLRSIGFILGNHFLTTHRTLSQMLGLNPVALQIFATVSVGNVQRMLRNRSAAPELQGEGLLEDALVIPMSRHAVARATGLPRETVRRQIAALIEQGLLVDTPEGVRTPTGTIKWEAQRQALHDVLINFAQSTEALLAINALSIRDAGPISFEQALDAREQERRT